MSEHTIERDRLSLARYGASGGNIIDISAPAGFGRTHLLLQWMSEHRDAGQPAVWLNMDGMTSSDMFVQGLAVSSNRAAIRAIDEAFLNWVQETKDPVEALTGWILEIRESGQSCLLLLDDADLASTDVQETVFAFVAANAPGNLRIAMSTRPGHPIFRKPAFFGLPLMRITAQDLRFSPDETEALVARVLPEEHALDLSSQLYQLTDGWPLGLQLALMSQTRGRKESDTSKAAVSALNHYFMDSVIDSQSDDVKAALAAIAKLDPIHTDLIIAVLGGSAPIKEVLQLAETTPIFIHGEDEQWLRIHPAAKEPLLSLHNHLPAEDRKAYARAATAWYGNAGMFEEAAECARYAGDTGTAIDLAERAVKSMTVRGRTSEVIRWLDQLPAGEIERRSGFWLPAAWAYANSNQADKVRPLLDALRSSDELSPTERVEALLIESTIASYLDDVVVLEKISETLANEQASMSLDEKLLLSLTVATQYYLSGHPRKARDRLSEAAKYKGFSEAAPVIRAYVDFYHALTFMWEGKPRLAYDYLAPVLERVETEFNRRSAYSTMIAALAADTLVDLERTDEARTVFLSRLPVLERVPSPDAIISGYTAMARLAEEDDRIDLADFRLSAIVKVGRNRGLPRLEAVGLSRLARMHSRHGHTDLANQAFENLKRFRENLPAEGLSDAISKFVELQTDLAAAALGGGDPCDEAIEAAKRARSNARALNHGREELLSTAWLGQSLNLANDPRGRVLMREASAAAKAWGYARLGSKLKKWIDPAPIAPLEANAPLPPASKASEFLTPREYDILQGLAAHLSNKEIALSLGLSGETVKWHLKNLFQKLEVGERKVAVARARILGII